MPAWLRRREAEQGGRKAAATLARENEAYAAQAAQRMAARVAFLQQTQAVLTPPELYALWVAVYRQQGGATRLVNGNYADIGVLHANGAVASKHIPELGPAMPSPDGPDYTHTGLRNWMPTRDFDGIPEGYGALALHLLIMPDYISANLRNTSGDRRQGWEYGHTRVFRLHRTSNPDGFYAATNGGYVSTYLDIEQIIAGRSIAEISAHTQAGSGRPVSRQPSCSCTKIPVTWVARRKARVFFLLFLIHELPQ